MANDPKVVAELILDLAKNSDGKTEFKPMELLSKTEQFGYRSISCAIGFHFHCLYLKHRDVIQRVGKGRYIRIGGNKPIVSGTKGRRVMEF